MTLETIIVDDEPLARERIRSLLRGRTDLQVVAECSNGLDALERIQSLKPDLVFLDIQMPELNGFGVLQRIAVEPMPAVIFVTAYDEHAVDAFEACAIDYLLKPYDRQRFERAVERAVDYCRGRQLGSIDERLLSLLERTDRRPVLEDRLVVRSGASAYFLKIEEIDWVEAARNYVKLHVGERVHTLRETLSSMEERLDPGRFLRIHRSTIVNIDRIRRIRPGFGTESMLELVDGTRLTISRAYRRGRVRELLG